MTSKMQTTKPPLAPGGACTGIVLQGSTAGFGEPVAYIAIPVSGPAQEPPSMQTTPQPLWWPPSPPTKQQQPQSPLPPGLTERLRKSIGGLGVAQIVTGLTSIAAESIAFGSSRNYMSIGAGIWCGVIFFITGVIAARAATTRRFGLVIGTMVMSIISACFFTCHLSLTAAFIKGDWNSMPQVVRALVITLSVLELIFSIACSACCCRAVCRKGCCCCCCVDFTTYENLPPASYYQAPQMAAPTGAPVHASQMPNVVPGQPAAPAQQSGGQLHPPGPAFTP